MAAHMLVRIPAPVPMAPMEMAAPAMVVVQSVLDMVLFVHLSLTHLVHPSLVRFILGLVRFVHLSPTHLVHLSLTQLIHLKLVRSVLSLVLFVNLSRAAVNLSRAAAISSAGG